MLELRDQLAIQNRLQSCMAKDGLDALILTGPETIFYASGFASQFLTLSNQIGLTAVVVPREGKMTLICNEFENQAAVSTTKDLNIVTYPVWIYIEDYDDGNLADKPAQPDLNRTFRMAAEIIRDTVGGDAKVGVEIEKIPYVKGLYLKETFGDNLVDATQTLIESRVIKTPWEIDVLRRAAQISEIAMEQTARQVVPGMTEADVMRLFKMNCQAQSPDVMDILQAHTFGKDFAPAIVPRHNRLNVGDVLRLDGGPIYCGYGSDLARTYVLGNKTDKRREEIYATLWKGNKTAINMLGPGVRMCDVFNAVQAAIKADIPGFKRGHHGHSIGCNRFTEEYPMISGVETRTFEPGMVFCLEMPYYSSKNNSFNIEDTFLITENGVEFFTMANESLYL